MAKWKDFINDIESFRAGKKIGKKAEDTRESVKEHGQQVKESLKETGEKISDKAEDARESLREHGQHAKESAEGFVEGFKSGAQDEKVANQEHGYDDTGADTVDHLEPQIDMTHDHIIHEDM